MKLNFQLSAAGENSPLEPCKSKWEAQRDTGWQLEDSISVSEKAFLHTSLDMGRPVVLRMGFIY